MRRINIEQLSDMEIAQMFGDYVDRMDAKPRHTRAAIKEAEAFDVMLESELPRNIRLQTLMYDKMMRCAIEYEESGFIAGFKTAMALMSGNDDLLPVPTEMEETPKSSQKQVLHPTLTNSTPKAEKPKMEIYTKPQQIFTKYMETTEIAKLFGRTNFKTVRSIKLHILPHCTEEEKENFIFEIKQEKFKKEQEIIKLSLTGCKIYLEYCNKLSYFKNFTEGAEKMKKVMEQRWCYCCA